jgi:hypothetical protein
LPPCLISCGQPHPDRPLAPRPSHAATDPAAGTSALLHAHMPPPPSLRPCAHFRSTAPSAERQCRVIPSPLHDYGYKRALPHAFLSACCHLLSTGKPHHRHWLTPPPLFLRGQAPERAHTPTHLVGLLVPPPYHRRHGTPSWCHHHSSPHGELGRHLEPDPFLLCWCGPNLLTGM